MTAMKSLLNKDVRLTVGSAKTELLKLGKGENTLNDVKIYCSYAEKDNDFKTIESFGTFTYVYIDENAVVKTFCTEETTTPNVDNKSSICSDLNKALVVYSVCKLLKYLLYHLGQCKTNFKFLSIVFSNCDSEDTEDYASTEKKDENHCQIVLNIKLMKHLEECLGAFVHEFAHFLEFCDDYDKNDHGDMFYGIGLTTATLANYHIDSIYKDLDYVAEYRICVNTRGRPIVEK